jgi:hypothetical protein
MRSPQPASLIAILLSLTLGLSNAEVRVLPPGALPRDTRLAPLKDLDGYFPFTPSASPEAWAKRREQVRRQILVSQGLWPMPEKTPLNAVIHGRIERADYTVEKVYFESMPGFFVTGNLYRPKGPPTAEGEPARKHPGVLCPHGHWPGGRFMDAGEAAAKKEIERGAERFMEAARSPLQARCVQLARMGCVTFHYDMIGYADATQIPMEIAHGFKKQRPEMNSAESWGLFSPQAEAHLQSVMGLQTWSSIRALDFLASLPDVDASRIGVTGASGGGTQTMILGAIDERVTAAFPAVMVSTAMQGGCTCENASLLRIETGNVEFAAMFAPKPMGLTAADDWTKEMAAKGFPELQHHWAMIGKPENVKLWPLVQFPHNFNLPSRAGMAEWFNQHLGLNLQPERLQEQDFQRLTKEEMSVWNAAHPAPAGGPEFERKLLRWWRDDAQRQITASPEAFREIAAPALEVVIGRTAAQVGDVSWELTDKHDSGAFLTMRGLVRNTTHGEELPAISFHPKQWNGATVLWLDELGKSGALASEGAKHTAPQPRKEVQAFIDAGVSVFAIDLFGQGEFQVDGQPMAKTPRVKNPREAAAYTFGYNPSVFARRAHDVLTLLRLVETNQHDTQKTAIVARGSTGPVAAAALGIGSTDVTAALLELNGFEFGKISDLHSPGFLPGGAKYGDIRGMLSLASVAQTYVVDPPPAVIGAETHDIRQPRLQLEIDPTRALESLLKTLSQSTAR